MSSKQRENNEKIPGGVTGKGFVKGDARINRKGRPRDFDTLRALVQSVGNEIAVDKDGQPILNPATGAPYTRIELAVRGMMSNPKQLKTLLAYGYGLPPQNVELTGKDGGPIDITDAREQIQRKLSQADVARSAPDIPVEPE